MVLWAGSARPTRVALFPVPLVSSHPRPSHCGVHRQRAWDWVIPEALASRPLRPTPCRKERERRTSGQGDLAGKAAFPHAERLGLPAWLRPGSGKLGSRSCFPAVGPGRMSLKLPRWQSCPQTYTVTWLFAKTGSDQLGECGGDRLSAVGLSTLRGLRHIFERPKKLHDYRWRAWT